MSERDNTRGQSCDNVTRTGLCLPLVCSVNPGASLGWSLPLLHMSGGLFSPTAAAFLLGAGQGNSELRTCH